MQVDELVSMPALMKLGASALHGGLSQPAREKTLEVCGYSRLMTLLHTCPYCHDVDYTQEHTFWVKVLWRFCIEHGHNAVIHHMIMNVRLTPCLYCMYTSFTSKVTAGNASSQCIGELHTTPSLEHA